MWGKIRIESQNEKTVVSVSHSDEHLILKSRVLAHQVVSNVTIES